MKAKRFLKKYGTLIFLFYLIKGLAWLIVPAALAAMTVSGTSQ